MSEQEHLTRRIPRWRRRLLVGLGVILCVALALIYLGKSDGESRKSPPGAPGALQGAGHSTEPSQAEGTIDHQTTAAAPVDVQVAKPIRRDIAYSIALPATLAPFYQTTLYAKVSGYLKWIGPDKGDWVKKDELVAIIDAPEVEEQYQQAIADHTIKKITFDRLNKVWKESPDVIAKQDVDVAEAAYRGAQHVMEQRQILRDYTKVRAPFAGVITARFADPGALIQTATTSVTNAMPLFTLMDIETIRIYMNVPQEEAPSVKPGATEAILTVNERSGRQFRGVVTRTTFALDPSTRSLLVEVDVPNKDHALQPGTFGEVTLLLHQKPNALVIPPGAIVTKDAAKSVFIVENNRAKLVPIRTGISDGRWVDVTEGLTGTEDIVVVGKAKLTEGALAQSSPYNLPEGTPAVQKFERRSATSASQSPKRQGNDSAPSNQTR
jgi:RND family efflux transporter MFP subunit